MDAIDHWLDHAVVAPQLLDPADADVVVLGEMNHFVHEKSDFRLALALAAQKIRSEDPLRRSMWQSP